MASTIRFYKDNQMEILTMEQVLTEQRMDLISCPRMMELYKDHDGKTTLYQEDILLLNLEDVEDDSNFWKQNIGKKMKELNLNQVLLHFHTSAYHVMEYRLFLKRDERFASSNTVREKDIFSEGKLYSPCFDDIFFVSLIVSNGGKVIGNALENPELLPGTNYQYC